MDQPYDLSCVVVNFNNVGTTYGKKVLKLEDTRAYHWEGVRLCVAHLTQQLGLTVYGVIFQGWKAWDGLYDDLAEVFGIPADIRAMCRLIEETPRITMSHQRSADDEMTIKMAWRRNCRFLDNDNYRDWAKYHPDEHIRAWLKSSRAQLQMNYYFDSELGCFETLDGNAAAAPEGRAASTRSGGGSLAMTSGARSSSNRSRDRSSGVPQSTALAGAAQAVTESVTPDAVLVDIAEGVAGAVEAAIASTATPCIAGAGRRRRGASWRRRSASRKPEAVAATADSDRRVHVGGLPAEVTWQDLKAHMAQVGHVEFAHVPPSTAGRAASIGRRGRSGRSGSVPRRLHGWVLFASSAEAAEAVHRLHGSNLQGASIRVAMWAPPAR